MYYTPDLTSTNLLKMIDVLIDDLIDVLIDDLIDDLIDEYFKRELWIYWVAPVLERAGSRK